MSQSTSSHLAPLASPPLYSSTQIQIPKQFPDILKEYAKFIIRTNPSNIAAASEEYFRSLAIQGGEQNTSANKQDTNSSQVTKNQQVSEKQLESLYNKLSSHNQNQIFAAEIQTAAIDSQMPQQLITDIIKQGGWESAALIPWMSFWILVASHVSGDFQNTIRLAIRVISDNNAIAMKPLINCIEMLASYDKRANSDQVKKLIDRFDSLGINSEVNTVVKMMDDISLAQ